jgi:Transglycosylase SLT domain
MKGRSCILGFCAVLAVMPFGLVGSSPRASAQGGVAGHQGADQNGPICQTVEAAAVANALPVGFFVRVIWQESRFQPDVIGPLTSGGERAEGIAQFMPGTASARGLSEPFNPVKALPESAAFLAELRDEFGNLGLAAAAYNAGPRRVHDFLSGVGDLPQETRNYVLAITGRPVEDWALLVKQGSRLAKTADASENNGPADCRSIVAQLEQTPQIVTEWHGHRIPNWCRDLRHPNVGVCGPVHAVGSLLTATHAATPMRSHVHLTSLH